MDKKIVLLKDLDDQIKYPVVDLLKSNGERLGCATTALINWIMKLNLFDPDKFSNVPEMALFYEMEFEGSETDGVKPEKCFEVIDKYLNENTEAIERYIYRADTAPFEAILTLLANDFIGLICSQTPNSGHCDIVFKDGDRIFYNCFEVNQEQLAEIIFSTGHNMMCLGRSLKTHKRFLMKASEMGSIKIKLTDEQKYMLPEPERFYLENDLLAMFDKYPAMKIPDLLKEKEFLLKNLGYLDEDTIIIYPHP